MEMIGPGLAGVVVLTLGLGPKTNKRVCMDGQLLAQETAIQFGSKASALLKGDTILSWYSLITVVRLELSQPPPYLKF